MEFTAKQIKAIKKAELLLSQANELLKQNIGHLDYDVIIAQKLSRVRNAVETSSLLDE